MAKATPSISSDDLRSLLYADIQDAHITRAAFAQMLGITPQAISVWVHRASVPRKQWLRMVEILGEQSRFARLIGKAPAQLDTTELQRRLDAAEDRIIQLEGIARQFLATQTARFSAARPA